MALFSFAKRPANGRINRRTAKQLSELDAHILRDIGIDPGTVRKATAPKLLGRV